MKTHEDLHHWLEDSDYTYFVEGNFPYDPENRSFKYLQSFVLKNNSCLEI